MDRPEVRGTSWQACGLTGPSLPIRLWYPLRAVGCLPTATHVTGGSFRGRQKGPDEPGPPASFEKNPGCFPWARTLPPPHQAGGWPALLDQYLSGCPWGWAASLAHVGKMACWLMRLGPSLRDAYELKRKIIRSQKKNRDGVGQDALATIDTRRTRRARRARPVWTHPAAAQAAAYVSSRCRSTLMGPNGFRFLDIGRAAVRGKRGRCQPG